MGKGKGAPEVWVAVIKPGRMLFEMEGVEPDVGARGAAAGGAQALDRRPRSRERHAGGSGRVKASELRDLSDDELRAQRARARARSCSASACGARPRSSTNPMKVRQTRRDLARVKTDPARARARTSRA